MTKNLDKPNTRTRVGDVVTIYKRGQKGRYTAEFWFDGDHRRRSLGTTNRKIAVQRAVQLESELAGGAFKRRLPRITIAKAAEQYLASLKTESRARRTLLRYDGELRLFIADMSGRRVVYLDGVTPAHLDRYRARRRRALCDATLYHEGVVIKQLFKWALSRGLISANPIANYKLTKPSSRPKPVPTLAQVSEILWCCSNRLAEQVLLLVCTGMRAGELQGIRKEDVDLQAGFLHVRRQIGGPTKTKDERKIPIHPCIRLFVDRLVAADDHELLVTNLPSPRYPSGGQPINLRHLLERFKSAAKRAGYEGFTLHSLRHAFNTVALNAGVPLPLVRRWMGHSVASMSEHYYDASDEASLRFMDEVPFTQLTAATSAATGGAKCTRVRLVR